MRWRAGAPRAGWGTVFSRRLKGEKSASVQGARPSGTATAVLGRRVLRRARPDRRWQVRAGRRPPRPGCHRKEKTACLAGLSMAGRPFRGLHNGRLRSTHVGGSVSNPCADRRRHGGPPVAAAPPGGALAQFRVRLHRGVAVPSCGREDRARRPGRGCGSFIARSVHGRVSRSFVRELRRERLQTWPHLDRRRGSCGERKRVVDYSHAGRWIASATRYGPSCRLSAHHFAKFRPIRN